MKEYINSDFLLQNEAAKKLYHGFSKGLPIIDYHCHISPKEICEDRPYENITQVWLYSDHYKWRIMRTVGIDEKYITGDGSDLEKFECYARALEKAVGNPLYIWSHMELKRYFGYSGILKGDTAGEVWNETKKYLREHDLSPVSIINSSNIETICTTDDPTDSLEWHRKLKKKSNSGELKANIFPAWRPDNVVHVEHSGFRQYISKLSRVSNVEISDIDSLKRALKIRLDFFNSMGCRVSDHAIDYVPYVFCPERDVEDIFKRALLREKVSTYEAEKYKTAILLFLFKQYAEMGWAAQLHYSCERNVNTGAFSNYGPDAGYDNISNYSPSHKLCALLNRIELESGLPKTVLYSLNPSDNAVIDSIIGSFQDGKNAGKIQHGAPWWFNDHKNGMEEMLTSLASRGVIGEFIGMLTDSRSFLSYERHDFFRRVLCNLIGRWVTEGICPEDYESLGEIVTNISYKNAKKYFDFNSEKERDYAV